MDARQRYESWSKQNLIARIAELEAQKAPPTVPPSRTASADAIQAEQSEASSSAGSAAGSKKRLRPGKKAKAPREFDIAQHPCRKIALRFSYEGSGYSGLAAQNGPQGTASPLPTVEAVLWQALATARLVDPDAGMEGAGWSRCGRTDRGVSAAGQVVALWVRSKRVDQWDLRRREERLRDEAIGKKAAESGQSSAPATNQIPSEPSMPPEPTDQTERGVQQDKPQAAGAETEGELAYVSMLNRILPTSIRVQAWSPVRPDFSARFDCTYRHYKYFFTAGPTSLLFPATKEGLDESSARRLDIDAMRDAASRLLGEHDFRNLCKVDASKQITNYRRRIDGVGIDLVSRGWPSASSAKPSDADVGPDAEPLYVFNLRGTAFLYHQVRNIMAILFLVGAKLEHPRIVDELMNVEQGAIVRDRIKMRLAAARGMRETSNSEPPPSKSSSSALQGEADGSDQEEQLKWWLPANATGSSNTDSTEWGRPQWMDVALSFPDESRSDAQGDTLQVYDTKPLYEMASDRPLMLWECGFLPTDVSWRAGPYDGSLPQQEGETDRIDRSHSDESAKAASSTIQDLHTLWAQMTIKTELQRHFMLASASPRTGRLPSRTEFEKGRWPVLDGGANAKDLQQPQHGAASTKEGSGAGSWTRNQGVVPLGYGTGRGAVKYIPMDRRSREESFVEKNRRWLETTGKRRAERGQVKAAAEDQ